MSPAPSTETLRELVLLASRAPSAHNTQPWSPRLVRGAVEVSVVPSRTLPAGDPTFRDLVLSLGAWVESFAIGAAALGRRVVVEPLPALEHLDELPVTGPADPAAPVLRITAPSASTRAKPYSTPFTPDDVRRRRVHRGRLRGRPGAFDDLSALALPRWLSLRRLDDRAMGQLSRLGIAFTASRRTVADELLHWLRLSPAHPQYHRDGMTDAMLAMPAALARLSAPATRRAALRDPIVAVAGVIGRTAESLGRDAPLPPYARSLAASPPDAPEHLVLVADTRAAGVDETISLTEAMDSRIGLPERNVLEAGRVLQRLWLHARVQGMAVSPHSELIDSPAAHGILRRRLSLGRADIALSVFSTGEPVGPVARSPRLTDVTG